MRNYIAADQELPGEVHSELQIPFFCRNFPSRADRWFLRSRGVIYHDINSTKMSHRLLDDSLHAGFVSDVELQPDGAAAQRLDLFNDGIQALPVLLFGTSHQAATSDVGYDDVGTSVCKP